MNVQKLTVWPPMRTIGGSRFASQVAFNKFHFKFAAEGCELTILTDGRAIVKGTIDVNRAKSPYAKHVGD